MAQHALNRDEALPDAWLPNILEDLLNADLVTDEAAVDFRGLDLLSEESYETPCHRTEDETKTASPPASPASVADSASQTIRQYTPCGCARTDDTIHKVDASEVIAQELRRMTISEQQVIFEDVNGISPLNEETPMFLSAKLDDLKVELTLINQKTAYNTAMEQNAAFVEDDALRLKFLRCVQYNPSIAAQRLVEFFELKLDLFGLELLTEEITMYDLSSEAQALLASGRIQKPPMRDSAGRVLVVTMKIPSALLATKAPAQMLFYFSTVLSEDEATQMSGLVGVHTVHDEPAPVNLQKPQTSNRGKHLLQIVPVKFQGFHFVAEDNPMPRQMANMMQLSFPKAVRHRFRTHFGSFRHGKEKLATYGIPMSVFPLTDDGDIELDAHLQWLEQRKIKEAVMVDNRRKAVHAAVAPKDTTIPKETVHLGTSPTAVDSIHNNGVSAADPPPQVFLPSTVDKLSSQGVTPNEKDVLLGRGRPFQAHSGNLYLKELIADLFDTYNAARRMGKMSVTEDVVHLINKRGGRFLKKTDAVWYEVELPEARIKVSHGFRKKREMDAAKLRLEPANNASSVARMMEGPKRIKTQHEHK